MQPLRLGDYMSLKKSIWRFLLFSRQLLKAFTDDTPISSSVKLFQRLMTRWEKNSSLLLQRQWFLTSFQLWPRVDRPSALSKKNDKETAVIPFTILKISIKSALFIRSSNEHKPNGLSLSSYGKLLRLEINRVKRCCTFSNSSLSFL